MENLFQSLQSIFGSKSISYLNVSDYKKWDRKHPMSSTTTVLNPNSYNLSRLTRDYYLLDSGKTIWQNTNISNKSDLMFRNKIKSRDYLCVMGMHSFSIKRLRDKLDLKIFIQIDDDLKESSLTKKDINKFLSENNEKNKIQMHNYIENQIKFSDLAFRFAVFVNTSSVKDIKFRK